MEWIRTTERQPLPGTTVRVVWFPYSPWNRKTATWDGRYWWTARKFGIYDEAPTYWLEVPPIPDPPKA